MSEVKKELRGFLYPNANKNKPTQPDLTGKVVINGIEYKISAWENKSSDNKNYLSLVLQIPQPDNKVQNTTSEVDDLNELNDFLKN